AATYEQALQGIEGLSIIDKLPKTSPCYHVYAVRIKNGQREKLIEYLNNKGIGINIHYPLTIPRQECYADDYRDKSFPEADSWAAETLSLPLAPSHSQAEINHVCNVVQDFFKKKV
ncbi:MAG: DegT/DnrJ/EryC1/StrS family aminotransferase, partial [Deltaproteobacteria bacterium]|nr:DegT/DnrJ/EryC1/StrS family aminotransferase [Deltaproteobacteria bacterium]